MGHSTPAKRPAKPRADFPLFPHRNGRWAKKIRGRFVYFGKWADDPKGSAAAALWAEQKDDLLAGRTPRSTPGSGVTVADVVNEFLAAKQALVDTGELKPRTWKDYYTVCERIIRVFGRSRLVSDLRPADFAQLRADSAKTRGPVALLNDIVRARVLFKFAYDQELIDRPIRYGQGFNRPNKTTLRVTRAKNGKRMFERDEILLMLRGGTIDRKKVAGASQPLKAMMLLAINGGLGNSDIAQLPLSAVDLSSAWIDFPRPKTGVARRIPLWKETIESLREWLAIRPEPKLDDANGMMFVTQRGGSWAKTEADNPISKESAKVLKRLQLHSKGLNFYSLRRTFRTIAGEVRDEPAANALMGHAPKSDDMAAVYTQRIDDDRLRAVVSHVRAWLFGKRKKK